MKKAQEFLVDSKLGGKQYDLPQQGDDKIVLSIEEGTTPVAAAQRKRMVSHGGAEKSLFQKLDEKFQSFSNPNARDKATFFRLLAIMVNAGVPLINSLDTIAGQTMNVQLKNAIFEMARRVEKGEKFSESMQHFPKLFGAAQFGMVRAGELSGQLNTILKQIATNIEKADMISRKVRSAMIYPAFVVLVMITVVSALMIIVVPKIATLFSQSGKKLPLITTIVIGISDFMVERYLVIFVALILLFIGFNLGRKTKPGSFMIDWLLIHVPIFGPLVKKSVIARFSRSLSSLLNSGIPIIEALLINTKTVDNMLYENRIRLAVEDVSRGIPLGESLRDSPEFPDMVVQMISVGEQTAQLDSIADKIAIFYEEEVDVAVAGISKVIEPFIIVVLGGVVGSIVAAIMLPIIQLTDLSQNF